MLITLKEYAQIHGRAPVSVRQLAARGGLKTAVKMGRDWLVDSEEPYPDGRTKEAKAAKKKTTE
ncbi:MAG: hypothetical protein LUF00_05755 [Lachnospiraceae bacterium]|nr:hypothetical protein [Lachnospiraceae bacterium]